MKFNFYLTQNHDIYKCPTFNKCHVTTLVFLNCRVICFTNKETTKRKKVTPHEFDSL